MLGKFKKFMLNIVGVSATLVSIGIIYLILFKQGIIKDLSHTFWIEFGIVSFLMVEMRTFWYKDTELRLRNSEEYIEKKGLVEDAIEETVDDAEDFDAYIDIENNINYNVYIKNNTDNVTSKNYKLTLFDKLQNLKISIVNLFCKVFHKQQQVIFSREYFFEKFKIRIQQKACKIHKLSSSGILTMSQQPLLDDRNYAAKHKLLYLLFGTITTILVIALAALIGFNEKLTDEETLTKFAIYTGGMLFAIGQTVVTATMSIRLGDFNYFRRILKIMDRYSSYKKARSKEEINNAYTSNETSSNKNIAE